MTHDPTILDLTVLAPDPEKVPARRPAVLRWLARKPVISVSAAAFAVMAMNGCSLTPQPRTAVPKQGASAGKVNAPTFAKIGAAARDRGDLITAAAMYQRALGLDPENADIMVGLADVLMDGSDYANAAKVYEMALAKQPDLHAAHMGLGKARVSLDQPAKAVPHFEAAVRTQPSPRAYNGLGVALDMAGDHSGAQKAYRAGMKLDGNYLPLKNNLGLSLTLAGKYGKAIEVLRETAAHPGSTQRERQNLALAYGLSGQRQQAERVSRIDLEESDVVQNIAYYDWLRKQPPAAVAVALRRGGAAQDEKMRREIAAARAEASRDGGKQIAQLAMAGDGSGLGAKGRAKPKGVADAPAVAACQEAGSGVNCLLAEAPPPDAGPVSSFGRGTIDMPGSGRMGPH